MKELSIDELRSKQLEILDDIDMFCVTNALNYSLAGGTLLGAIRHKGYIPWDDDIDIMMPRPDYDYFLKHFKNGDKYSLHHIDSKGDLYFPRLYSKLSLNDTLVEEPNTPDYFSALGINVDIFPLDSFKATRGELEGKIKIVKSICSLIGVSSTNIRGSSIQRKMLYFILRRLKFILMPVLFNRLHCLTQSNKQFLSGKLVVSFGSIYGSKDIASTSLYSDYEDILFEHKHYKKIKDHGSYLKMLYGEYMKLPPEELRLNHSVRAYSISTGGA